MITTYGKVSSKLDDGRYIAIAKLGGKYITAYNLLPHFELPEKSEVNIIQVGELYGIYPLEMPLSGVLSFPLSAEVAEDLRQSMWRSMAAIIAKQAGKEKQIYKAGTITSVGNGAFNVKIDDKNYLCGMYHNLGLSFADFAIGDVVCVDVRMMLVCGFLSVKETGTQINGAYADGYFSVPIADETGAIIGGSVSVSVAYGEYNPTTGEFVDYAIIKTETAEDGLLIIDSIPLPNRIRLTYANGTTVYERLIDLSPIEMVSFAQTWTRLKSPSISRSITVDGTEIMYSALAELTPYNKNITLDSFNGVITVPRVEDDLQIGDITAQMKISTAGIMFGVDGKPSGTIYLLSASLKVAVSPTLPAKGDLIATAAETGGQKRSYSFYRDTALTLNFTCDKMGAEVLLQ